MDVLDNQETVGKLCFLCRLKVDGPCVQLRALFINVGMIFLSSLRVMKCIGIHEREKTVRVHGDSAKREENRGATSIGIAGVVHSKEASHSSKGTPRSKALYENSRGSKNFEEECQGVGGERVWREAPSCNARVRLANVFEIGGGCNVWKGGEIGLTVIKKLGQKECRWEKNPER